MVSFQGQKNPQKHKKSKNYYSVYGMRLFVNVVWTFKYSLASTAFPKTKNCVICTKLPMGAKFHFCEWKIYFSQFIFIDKYLKFNEIEYPIMLNLKCGQSYFM